MNEEIRKLIKEKFKEVEKIEAVKGEIKPDQLVETNYPEPIKRKFLVFESFGTSIEESYFWTKDMLAELGFIDIDKIVDTFTASEQSAFFGSAQQRLGIQQDKVTAYLATIGRMVKEMFQIVRDIKLLEERDNLYKLAATGDDGAEKSLKGVWIDFVDNGPGQLKASSVYGLASQIGYTVLPDLFFAAPVNIQKENVSSYVKKLDFNEKVKTALVRKLEQFVAWRDATAREIDSKRKFTIQYLRQHYNAIQLYVDWIKPYLRNIRRLEMNPEMQLSSNIVGAFEGSVLEIEFLAKKPGNPHPCVLATFTYRTRPIMQTGQDFQRGPMHIGRMEMTLRGYVWTDDEIKEYKKIKMEEDFEMLKSIDKSIEQAMEYLGDELKRYLEAAGEKFGKEGEREELAQSLLKTKAASSMEEAREKAKNILEGKTKQPSMFEPFTSIFTGFKELGKGFIPEKNELRAAKRKEKEIKEAKKDLSKFVSKMVTLTYILYKKSHKMIVP